MVKLVGAFNQKKKKNTQNREKKEKNLNNRTILQLANMEVGDHTGIKAI